MLARRYYELAVRGGIPEASEALGHLDFHGLGMPPQEHDGDGDRDDHTGAGSGVQAAKKPKGSRATAGRAYPLADGEDQEPRPDMASAKKRFLEAGTPSALTMLGKFTNVGMYVLSRQQPAISFTPFFFFW